MFLEFVKLNPDELIQKAKEDDEYGELIHDFFNFQKLRVSPLSAHMYAFGVIRGFFTHNKINTNHWKVPRIPDSKVHDWDENSTVYV